MDEAALKVFLNKKLAEYNSEEFIIHDPVSIPHLYSKKQDIEIAGFFASIFAWGNRSTIISKCKDLFSLMDDAPYEFITQHRESDLEKLLGFKHRTFNATDLLYFIAFFRHHYSQSNTLETAFTMHGRTIEEMLIGFRNYFFSLEDFPHRTQKHIPAPQFGSACKRLNMYLRWMVRKDGKVDFGIWKKIQPSDLICPLDLHVARVARHFRLLERKQTDWKAALELTANLRKIDPKDPVKYDLALFGMGVLEKYGGAG